MLKLHNGNKTYITEKTDKIVHKKNVSLVNKNSDYLLSHAVSLWKKDFLIEQLNKKSNETPRENEIIWTFRMKLNKKLPKIYQYDLFSTETETDDICHSSYREVCRKWAYNKNIKEFIDILLHKKYNTQ